jgi:hypothetical protein
VRASCADVEPRSKSTRMCVSCIHVCMYERRGTKTNVMCVSCAHVCMHEEPEMRTKVCVRGVFKCTSMQCVYA